jgi:hypothetical protein
MRHMRQIIIISFSVFCGALLWNIYSVQMEMQLPTRNPRLVRSQAVHNLNAAARRQEQLLGDFEQALRNEEFRFRALEIVNASVQEHGIPGALFEPQPRRAEPQKPWYKRLIAAISCTGNRR